MYKQEIKKMKNRIFSRFMRDFRCLLLLLSCHLFIHFGLEKIMKGLGQTTFFGMKLFHLLEYEKSRLGSWFRDYWSVGAQGILFIIISFL